MGIGTNVRQRKDGSFEARYKTGRNEKGRTAYKSCYGKTYDEAVEKLQKRGIDVITHVILGLPGEGIRQMKETVRYVCAGGVKGIKLQLLHILKGTDLEREYLAGRVPVMTEDEYIGLVTELVKEIPLEIVIHRLTGDGAKKDLIAPLWSADKKHVLNKMRQFLQPKEKP